MHVVIRTPVRAVLTLCWKCFSLCIVTLVLTPHAMPTAAQPEFEV
jgi:hypothetical protein